MFVARARLCLDRVRPPGFPSTSLALARTNRNRIALRRISTGSGQSSTGSSAYWSGVGGIVLGAGIGATVMGWRESSPALGYNYYVAANSPPSSSASVANVRHERRFHAAIAELKTLFPDEDVSTDAADLHSHGFSENDYHPDVPHSVIVYPRSTEDVVKIVKVANKYRMPITPYSGATSLEGHYRGHEVGGICVDMNNMDQILEIHDPNRIRLGLSLSTRSGWMDINETLKSKGIPLFFPIDPGPGATIGGMLSTGCSGTNAVRYGTAKGNGRPPSGEVIKTRQRSRKSSAGFDTTKLFIGAEGTLGIVTEGSFCFMSLVGINDPIGSGAPYHRCVVRFPDVRKATEAVIEVMNQGVGIQCVELVDSAFIAATNKYGQSKRTYPISDHLFFKFQGPTPSSLRETAEVVKSVVERHGGEGFEVAKDKQEADDLWSDRKNALYSGLALVEGGRGWSTDVCVPVSNLPDLIYATKKDLSEIGLVSTIVGHVGDGNFHAFLMFRNDEELEKAREAVHRMVERAIELDGTCTGEHGVGIGKKEYLIDELGLGTVELMKKIKKAIDPLGLFNPGKLYPDTPPRKKGDHAS
ncbi:FAD-linked oxidase-like protein [Cyathus striatus]|nr:FAD-linked oxidase-like protein [Cyathus striatus]